MQDRRYKLIRSRFLLPFSDKLGREKRISDGYVLTEGSVIKEAGEYRDETGARIISQCGSELTVIGAKKEGGYDPPDIPCLRGVVMPGFVKAHGHDHESPLIGIAKDEPLTEWLDHAVNLFTGFMNEERPQLEKHFGKSPNFITYIKARLDDIYYGITSSMVHHCNHNKYRVEEIVEANKQAGTKMIIAVGGQDRNYDARILDKPGEAVKRLDDYIARFGPMEHTWIIPGPDQDFSNGPEQLKSLKQWARDHGTLIHIHSSEEPNTTRWFRKEYGQTPTEYFQSIGFLDGNTIIAHQVNNTDHDLELLRDTGTKIVHNPLANTIIGSGMPPLIKMMEMGIPVVIATDGSGSADNQNILMAAKSAAQYQKALNQNARLLPSQKLLELITIEPAKFLRFNTGSIEAGKDADIIFLDLTVPNLTPTRLDNVMENLIWASNGNEVRHVIAGGKILMRDGAFTTLDEEKIKREVQELSELFTVYREKAAEIRGTGAHR
ncbi:MAG: amidohydrolase family protein [Candidatus Eremiobacteraeota bacterium]|nr:amidohydrolase family protein [Candidatus Eremiobacteraeota bacterium]